MNASEPLAQIASTGIVGALLVLAIIAIVYLHRQLSAEKDARIEDSQKFTTLAMSMQKEVIAFVHKHGDMMETQKDSQKEILQKLGDIADLFKRYVDDDRLKGRR